MASWARLESRSGSPAIQSRAWVSSRITGSASFGLPIFQWRDWSYDVADDLYLAGHIAEDLVGLLPSRDELDHGFAVLGDHHGLSAVQDPIHDSQALRFELAGGDLFHNMVIL